MAEDHSNIKQCAVIIIAAGKSARLGKAKQLLPFGDKTLLEHAADVALSSGLRPVIVVLGSGREQAEEKLAGLDLRLVNNEGWEEGMASSIRCGISELVQHFPQMEGTVIMVCDQPFVSPALLNHMLMSQHESGKPVVAASYEGITGTPVLFHQRLFPFLMELKGDQGARKLLMQHPEWIEKISFPEGKLDIDTESDYKNLQQWEKNPST